MTDAAIHTTPSDSGSAKGKFLSAFSVDLSLSTVNRVLGILAALALAYFVVTLFFGAVKLIGVGQHIRKLEAQGAADVKPAQEKAASARAAIDPALDNRNIFQPAGTMTAVSSESASSGQPMYRLVGISESKNLSETYVMVENSQTKLTYFLQYGQPVEGLELERILEDKVIVKIGGKAVELE